MAAQIRGVVLGVVGNIPTAFGHIAAQRDEPATAVRHAVDAGDHIIQLGIQRVRQRIVVLHIGLYAPVHVVGL